MPEFAALLPSVVASQFLADASKLTVVVGALWALFSYSRNSRTNAAEIVIDLEEKYVALQPILLRLEYQEDFDRDYAPALRKVIAAIAPKVGARSTTGGDEAHAQRAVLLTAHEGRAIDELERVFRYFHLCLQIRRLGVDARSLDFLCHYYLRLFRRHDRALVLEYLRAYWPSLGFWAEVAGLPAPRRLAIATRQLAPRLRAWWNGPAQPVESLGHSPLEVGARGPRRVTPRRESMAAAVAAAHAARASRG